ncbi:MAG: FGGY-family carbohydrate kinase, partial [Phycisphaerae bacterium]|nr:FGGY-family carbohydrate kinase [Phycisphaerae bacterium]
MELVLGIDLGSSYFKLGLFDRAGQLRGLGRVAVQPDRGDGSRCEWPVERFWDTLRTGLADALGAAGGRPADIRGVSYGSQANSFVLLDQADQPITPLILWPDARTAGEPDEAIDRLSRRDDFLATTGLGMFGVEFAVAKVRWLRRHQPDAWRRVARIQTISDYLVFGLTGERLGDVGTASLLGLFDLPRGCWWPAAMDELELDAAIFSTPLPPGGEIGLTTAAATERMGLPAGVPMAAGSLDHHMAAVGAGAGTLAPVSESTGTVIACLRYLDEFRPLPGCCMGLTGQGAPQFYQLAFDDGGAGSLEWYLRTYTPNLTMSQLLALAAAAPPGCDGLTAKPGCERYPGLGGFAHAAAAHTPGHYSRAILEATAASLARLVDTLCPSARPERIVATGGASRSDLWLQIKADATGATLVSPACPEPACLGAAILAAVAAGWFAEATE